MPPFPPPLVPPQPGPVLVGYSGGLDSTVLLHRLAQQDAQRRRGLRAIHVHHGLHGQADDWAAHCRHFCDALGVPLAVVRVEVRDDHGAGPEAAARAARHAAFAAELRPDEVLALAHHRDDQAETFLLRALRASGVDGLAAMRPWRRYGRGWLWRPLLDRSRTELLAHARTHAQAWIEDPSNAGIDPDRNYLRHQVLPLLRERWPQAEKRLARSAALAAQADALLDREDAAALAAVRTPDPQALDVPRLLQWPSARRARMLRRWVDALGLPPLPAQGVARIEAELLPAAADRVPAFAWSGAVIRRWRGLLHAGRQRHGLPAAFQTAWNGSAPLHLPTGDTLALQGPAPADAGDPFLVHARQGGERIRLAGRRHSHALKHVLQDLGVPPWVRERLPLLSAADGTLLAAGDLALSATLQVRLKAQGRRLLWSDAMGST